MARRACILLLAIVVSGWGACCSVACARAAMSAAACAGCAEAHGQGTERSPSPCIVKPLAEAAGESFASSVAPVLPVVIVAWRPGAVGSSAAGEGIALAHQDRYLLFGRLVV